MNHSSRWLRAGSSGADHSKPSSSTAFVRMWMSSESCRGLIASGSLGGGVESSQEFAQSSASETVRDIVSSKCPRIRQMKPCRSHEMRGIGLRKRRAPETRERGTSCSVLQLRCFFHLGSRGEENGRTCEAGLLSLKKVIHERSLGIGGAQASYILSVRRKQGSPALATFKHYSNFIF